MLLLCWIVDIGAGVVWWDREVGGEWAGSKWGMDGSSSRAGFWSRPRWLPVAENETGGMAGVLAGRIAEGERREGPLGGSGGREVSGLMVLRTNSHGCNGCPDGSGAVCTATS